MKWKHRSQGPKASGQLDISQKKVKKVKPLVEEKLVRGLTVKLRTLLKKD